MEAGSDGRLRPTRYAHFEGHTDLTYTNDGKFIVTCGSDGEVRVFEGLDDDDCKTHVVADCAHAIAYRAGCFLVANDTNLVQAFSLEDGSPTGIITRFSAPATHVVVSRDGRKVACAGSDMSVRVHDVTSYKDKEFTGHKAPVLSVALDHQAKFLATSSCDGSVKVWNVESGVNEITWSVLPQSNSFESSTTLCRLVFTPSGHLLVPVGSKVLDYEGDRWGLVGEFTSDKIKDTISVLSISLCGTLLVGGCKDGLLVVWSTSDRSVLMVKKHPKGLGICGLAWNPSVVGEFAFTDVGGNLGTAVEVDRGGVVMDTPIQTPAVQNGEGGDQDVFPPLDIDQDDDDDEFSISRIKAQLGFADDEEGTFIGTQDHGDASPKAGEEGGGGGGSGGGMDAPPNTVVPYAPIARLPDVQKPFQPGMTPDHLAERYMVWNSVGIVRQYTGEDDSTIDVEFHDTSTHHSIHINNSVGYSIAALSSCALVLAAEKQEEQASKVTVQNLTTAINKEWTLDMAPSEDITALASGRSFVAVATDKRNVRVFGLAGTQRDILSIPGPVVCLNAFDDLLMVVWHCGLGVSGDQQMATMILAIGGTHHPLPRPTPVPLGPKSFLAWAGFSDEGTPLLMDSSGVVRALHGGYGAMWTPILDTRAHVRGKSDHYFMVGGSELQGQIRCILCKGSRFPLLIPKPHVSLLGIKIPVCEGDTEKGELEEKMCRTSLLLQTLKHTPFGHQELGSADANEEAERVLQEAMIKLFALACRSDKECRAVEICRLMPSYNTVTLAIKYAAKIQRMTLADKLGEVAKEKMEEERVRQERDRLGEVGNYRYTNRSVTQEDSEEEFDQFDATESEDQVTETSNPLLIAAKRKVGLAPSPNCDLASKNPFRKTHSGPTPTPSPGPTSSSRRSIDVIDSFRKAMRKETTPILRPVMKKTRKLNQNQDSSPTTRQPQLQQQPQPEGKENQPNITTTPTTPTTPSTTPKSALQLYIDDHRDELQQGGEMTERELLVKGAVVFKDLDPIVKQKYKDLATSRTTTATTTTAEEEKKRPREEEDGEALKEDEGVTKKIKDGGISSSSSSSSGGSGRSKLSAFVFTKN